MPTTDHGWPYPSPNDARNVPDDIMALAEMADQHGVYYATGSTDRDARFSDLPVGALVSSGSTGQIWQKAGVGRTWMTLWSDTGKIETGFEFGDGWEAGSYVQARNKNGLIDIRIEGNRTGDDIVAPSNGNITDTTLVVIPPQFTPVQSYIVGSFKSSATSGGAILWKTGSIALTDMNSLSTIANSAYVRVSFTFLEG